MSAVQTLSCTLSLRFAHAQVRSWGQRHAYNLQNPVMLPLHQIKMAETCKDALTSHAHAAGFGTFFYYVMSLR